MLCVRVENVHDFFKGFHHLIPFSWQHPLLEGKKTKQSVYCAHLYNRVGETHFPALQNTTSLQY